MGIRSRLSITYYSGFPIPKKISNSGNPFYFSNGIVRQGKLEVFLESSEGFLG